MRFLRCLHLHGLLESLLLILFTCPLSRSRVERRDLLLELLKLVHLELGLWVLIHRLHCVLLVVLLWLLH